MNGILVVLVAANYLSSAANIVTVGSSDELLRAVTAARSPMTVEVEPGRYEIDNPIYLETAGLALRGAGLTKVRLYPKNSGEPIFVIDADDVSISGVTIDGRGINRGQFAAFGVYIGTGVRRFTLAKNLLRNFQATAVLGYDLEDCSVTDNIIHSAAGDGIRTKGDGLTISDNWIVGVFDEPLDLAGGNAVVKDNRIGFGRIGIALESWGGSSLVGNLVVDQYEVGIVVSLGEGDEVANNAVADAGVQSYQLINDSEEAKTVSQSNVACYAAEPDLGQGVGRKPSDSVMRREVACPIDEADLIRTMQMTDGGLRPWVSLFLETSSDESEKGPLDERMARHLRHLNPGILSARRSEATIHSAITDSLQRTLVNWPDLASGPIRWPFLRSRIDRWYLESNGKTVLLVTRRYGGSKVRVTKSEDGELRLMDRVILLWDSILVALSEWRSWLA